MTQNIQILRTLEAKKRPDPEDLLQGQLAANINPTEPGLYFSDTAGNLRKVGPCHVGNQPPNSGVSPPFFTGNCIGELWYDTNANQQKLKIWSGSAWLTAQGGGGAGNLGDLSLTNTASNPFLIFTDSAGTLQRFNLNASLTQRGQVQLSSSLTDTSETLAATPRAISLLNTSLGTANSNIATLQQQLLKFRDSNRVYVSKSIYANDSNDGTSPGEPLLTLGAAAAAAQPGDLVEVGPGLYVEPSLPIRWKRDVGVLAKGLRNARIQPAAGQEYNDIFKVDSGFWCWGIEFTGHQADSVTGKQAWAISFNETADNTALGAVGLGAYIFKSPYIQNCSSITAEDDNGNAGSQSVGDTGGGLVIDGDSCAKNSPIRSMVVDSFTQVNLGGPGCLVKNDGYAQLVSFFGTFCNYHVRSETGGQVNLSGGGTSDFGTYGLMAEGYSPSPLYTAKARVLAFGASRVEKIVTFNVSTDVVSCADPLGHTLSVNDQVVFSCSQGTFPGNVSTGTKYYVISSGLTTSDFKVSLTQGGSPVDFTGTATGTYSVIRQGETEVDVISLGANRLGRKLKYPAAGSLGSPGNPVAITARSGSSAGSSFTVTLDTSTIVHEYVGGGTVTVGANTYPITSCTYNNLTGSTVVTATGYAPVVGAQVTLQNLFFTCSSSSRPNSGTLMFPQLTFPSAGATPFTYTKTGPNTFTYLATATPSGPDHEYVSGGTVTIGSTNYGVVDCTYVKNTGLVTIVTVTPLPSPLSGTVTVEGLNFICPTSAYVITGSVPIDINGNPVAFGVPSQAGYRISFYSGTNGGLKNPINPDQTLDFRNRSQVSAPSHTFEYVGAGTNYDALPFNGGVPVPANKIVEVNNGRVFSSNTDELGNFAVGNSFNVDGTSGSVTINTSQFNLSGLNFIGPFSRNGGISTVGEQLREVSNNTSLISSTGVADGNTAPTQFAVRSYSDNRYLAGLSTTVDQPVTLTDTSTQNSSGFWTRSRNIQLTMNAANGLLQLSSSGLVPADRIPNTPVAAGNYTYGSFTVGTDGRLTAAGSGTAPIASVLTGFTSGPGTVTATDTILGAIQKLNGNIAAAVSGSVSAVTGSLPIVVSTGATPNVTINAATATTPGSMSAADKLKVDGLGTASGSAVGDFLPTTFIAGSLTYATPINLDMSALAGRYMTLNLAGDPVFTTSNRASGRQVTIRMICDSTPRAPTFPASWVFIGNKPSSIAANKTAVISLTFFGSTDADCVAAYGVQV